MPNQYDELRSAFLAAATDAPLTGAVFEVGTAGACASVLCHDDGTTSLYLSVGGGQIGLGEHEPVRRAARAYLDEVTASLALLAPSDGGHVEQGWVQFLAVTPGGVLGLTTTEDDAAREGSPAFDLFLAGEAVVTQIRLFDELRRGRKTF